MRTGAAWSHTEGRKRAASYMITPQLHTGGFWMWTYCSHGQGSWTAATMLPVHTWPPVGYQPPVTVCSVFTEVNGWPSAWRRHCGKKAKNKVPSELCVVPRQGSHRCSVWHFLCSSFLFAYVDGSGHVCAARTENHAWVHAGAESVHAQPFEIAKGIS